MLVKFIFVRIVRECLSFFFIAHMENILWNRLEEKYFFIRYIHLYAAINLIVETISSIIPPCNYFHPREGFLFFYSSRERTLSHCLYTFEKLKLYRVYRVIESIINGGMKKNGEERGKLPRQMDGEFSEVA